MDNETVDHALPEILIVDDTPLNLDVLSSLLAAFGSHFDPVVVQVFLAAESEVLRIHHRYGDDSPTGR